MSLPEVLVKRRIAGMDRRRFFGIFGSVATLLGVSVAQGERSSVRRAVVVCTGRVVPNGNHAAWPEITKVTYDMSPKEMQDILFANDANHWKWVNLNRCGANVMVTEGGCASCPRCGNTLQHVATGIEV